jgi:formylglycine-generating enzyme required for sulfatase activity/cephalosporin-C deacetylase-like acetyl esterase
MTLLGHRFSERKVAQWAIGYLAASWGALQVLELLWDVFEWPLGFLRVIIGVLAVGFPVTVGLAWMRRPPGGIQPVEEGSDPAGGKPLARTLVSVAAVLVLLVVVGWTVKRSLDGHWAHAEAVVEMGRLAEAGDFAGALAVGERALRINADLPEVEARLAEVSSIPSIETVPSGAEVLLKEYTDGDGPWTFLGITPLSGVRVPLGLKRWRIVRDGFESVERALSAGASLSLTLQPEGSVPEGMVRIPGGSAGGFITGMGPLSALEYSDYFIDRYEVTNAAYAEFVEAGGYEREEFWTQEFMDEGRRLTWAEAMTRFEDLTGRPGPGTWELGRPEPGQESLPVTGVSWYEAAAYAEFRGRRLPTLRHWVRAAGTEQGGSIIPLSNLDGEGPAAPGTFTGMSPSGVFDMAGNVREWVLNSAGVQRHAVGGAWSDPSYFFSGPNVQSPFDRLPSNGFRLADYQDGDFEGEAEADMPLLTRDYDEEQPVSDEVFQVFADQFDYDPAPLEAVVEETIEYEFGTIERVSFDGVGWGRIHGYLYLPGETEPPFQTVVWFPGSGAARLRPDTDPRDQGGIQHFVASGRAVFWPVVRGTYSRADADQPPNMNTTWPKPTREYVEYVRSWVSEVRRSIDYLETRPEIDGEKLAYYGTSWGGRLGAIVPAVETRFKLNLLMLGGLASGTALPEVDQINYVTRITVPTLMLNGRHDPLEPVATAQLPMLRLLGTPDADKHHIIYEGHAHSLPRNERSRETLDWLDRYFGAPR